jgi:DNA-binding MarR family transcriptional regulator
MDPAEQRSGAGEAASDVILATFRTNGLLLASGDLLAEEEGLTSARWQVLGAIALAERPLTVPQIARRMGLTRQSVHATVGRLVSQGILELLPNADHQRSQLVRLTPLGQEKWAAMDRRQAVWVNRLAEGLGRSKLESAARVLEELCRRLEAEIGQSSRSHGERRAENGPVAGTRTGGRR